MTISYLPLNAARKEDRVKGSLWSLGPGGIRFVVPLDGPRRFVRVRKIRDIWVEQLE